MEEREGKEGREREGSIVRERERKEREKETHSGLCGCRGLQGDPEEH